MSIQTMTLTVNAAFLQEIKEDNVGLSHLVEQLESQLDAPVTHAGQRRRLADLLAALRDQLAFHFALEEAYGYMEDPLLQAPRLSETAEMLRQQHNGFYIEAITLAEEAIECAVQENEITSARLTASIRSFLRRFKKHEVRERELILDAFDLELGVGD